MRLFRSPLAWILALAAAALVTVPWGARDVAFFTHDAEAELLAVRSIVESGFRRVSIPWTEAYDRFHEELLPFSPNFLTIHDHRLYASRPLLFLWLSAVMYGVLGVAGLYVIPAAAGVAVVALADRLTRGRPGIPGVPFVPFLALTTPVLFYALVYWNMILGALVSTLAVVLLRRRPGSASALTAGAVLGLGAGVRPDLLVVAALLAVWVLRRSGWGAALRLAIGAGLVTAALLAVNVAVFGNALGPHLAGNRVPLTEWITSRPQVLYELFVTSLAPPPVEVLTVLAGAAALGLTSVRGIGDRARAILWSLFALGSAGIALATLRSGDPFAASLQNHSLLACAPVLFLVFLFPAGEEREARSLRWLAVAYLLVTALLCPSQAAFAAHWGPRMLLALLPVAGVVAYGTAARMLATRRSRWMAPAIAVLLLVGLVNQASSLRLLHARREETVALRRALQDSELPIVTDRWTLPVDLASWYPRRALWFPAGPEDLERILEVVGSSEAPGLVSVARGDSPLHAALEQLSADGTLRLEEQHPLKSVSFPYRGADIRVYAMPR